MNKSLSSLFALVLLCISASAYAQPSAKVVHLSVSGMTTPTCPVLLKSAVRNIEGVTAVEASLEQHSATIEFDANITSLENIQEIIANQVGFSTQIQ